MSYPPTKMKMEFVLNPRPIDFFTLNLGIGETERGLFLSLGNKSIILGLILKIVNATSKIRL